jgi:hypothetical protein
MQEQNENCRSHQQGIAKSGAEQLPRLPDGQGLDICAWFNICSSIELLY